MDEAEDQARTAAGAEKRRHLFRRLRWEDLDPAHLLRLVALAREEDLAGAGLATRPATPGAIDLTTAGLPTALGAGISARLVAREAITPCGLSLVPLVLETYGGGSFEAAAEDGGAVAAGGLLGTVSGRAEVLLPAERTLLNFVQRLSGVATQTARYVAALGDPETRLLDTRKTTPGFRALEKYAVACGGGWNHRMGLFDRVMLKDNHLAAAGAGSGEQLAAAVRQARARDPARVVEVEVDRPDQIEPAVEAGADVILLDNFGPAAIADAVLRIGGRALTEASGGIRLETLPSFARLGLDFISVGALIHAATWVDIGLDMEEA